VRKVLILVEGQTEERFVKDVLQPHLWSRDVHPEPKIVTTKVVKVGPQFKGGVSTFRKIETDVLRLLGDSDAALVTTMFDYYGLPDDFPGKGWLSGRNSHERTKELEAALEKHFDRGPKFVAYLMIHEFEALLFSAPGVLAQVMNLPSFQARLKAIRDRFPTPEDINDNPSTTPSARVLNLFPGYRKRLHGSLTTGRIGLDVIRRECEHFNQWVTKLEGV
jgi:Domain of unknown function (DUF4276)